MVEIDIVFTLAVFIAGIFMFLAPCTLPLVPAYLAFISGIHGRVQPNDPGVKRRLLISALMFSVGFTVVFVGLGLLAGWFGEVLAVFHNLLRIVGGLFVIVFALLMLGLIHFPVLDEQHTFSQLRRIQPGSPKATFFIGAAFALGWTPCIGPILASVLLVASSEGSVLAGGWLLFVFSLGMALPFLLTAYFYSLAQDWFSHYQVVAKGIQTAGGLLLLLVGVLLLTDTLGALVQYGTPLFNTLGLDFIYNYF